MSIQKHSCGNRTGNSISGLKSNLQSPVFKKGVKRWLIVLLGLVGSKVIKTKQSSEEMGRCFLLNVPQLRIGQGSKASVLEGRREAVRHLAGYMTLWG